MAPSVFLKQETHSGPKHTRRASPWAARLLLGLLPLLGLHACTSDDDKEPQEPAPPPDHPVAWSSQQRELYYGIPVQVRFQPANAALEREVWAYLEHVDEAFNDFRQDSDIGRLNAELAHAQEATVSAELAGVLRFAHEAWRKTDGTFDVTVGPLRDLWRKAAEVGRMPDEAELRDTRSHCGFDKVSLKDHTVRTSVSGIRFDLGGCIKGWAVDRVIDRLRKGGAQAALVQVGGETGAYGLSPRGRPHVLGIQHPLEMDQIWTAIQDHGHGLSAATSGNYRAPLLIGNRIVYHIYDPRTGRPADLGVLSVSVVFPATGRNAWADACSTAGTILDRKAFFDLIRREGGEALILTRRPTGHPTETETAAPGAAEPSQIQEYATPGWRSLQDKE